MFLVYDFIFVLYALIYLPYLLLTGRWYEGFGLRFGFFPQQLEKDLKAKANIWIHAVSVGEVMAVEGLIDRIKAKYPSHQLVLTVTTKTGYCLAKERFGPKLLVLPSPLDLSFVARRFVLSILPKAYIAIETEIWPNLYNQLYQKKIPLLVINGRISDTSLGRYKAIRFLLKGILNQASLWCMQSKQDAQRIMDLGAEASRVIVTGNIKFDQYEASSDTLQPYLISEKQGPLWLAGSTHPGEEEIILDVYGKVLQEHPQWRLMIAPRHIERVGQIMELVVRRRFKVRKLSEINNGDDKAVIVVDTIGQLRSLYATASLVFVGKTLCVGGGHNVIEPAFFGKAIVIGPKFQNFKDIVSCFKAADAIVQVDDVVSFEASVRDLCRDEAKREILGRAAQDVIKANQGATQRSLEALSEFLR